MRSLLGILGGLMLFGPAVIAFIAGLYCVIFPLTAFSILFASTIILMVLGFSILIRIGVL